MQKKFFKKVAAIKSNGAESEYYIYILGPSGLVGNLHTC